MKDRQVSLKKVLLVSILSCLMISSTAAYLAAAAASDYYQVITGGQYPGAPSFTIYAQDGVYYAKNQYGGISWSSTDADTVIQNANDALTTGGTIYLTKGIYPYDSISLSNSVNLIGETSGTWVYPYYSTIDYGTVLVANSADSIIKIEGAGAGDTPYNDFNTISNIQIDGNNLALKGISLKYAWGTTLDKVSIRNCVNQSLYIEDYVQNLKVTQSEMVFGAYGVQIDGIHCNSIDFDNTWIARTTICGFLSHASPEISLNKVAFTSTTQGIRVYNPASSTTRTLTIDGCWFESITGNSVELNYVQGFAVKNSYFYSSGLRAIYLNHADCGVIESNQIRISGINHIYLTYAYANTIQSNYMETTTSGAGIELNAFAQKNNVGPNVIKSSGTGLSVNATANSVAYNTIAVQDTNDATMFNNGGLYNERPTINRMGSATISVSATSTSFPHYLGVAPAHVDITWTGYSGDSGTTSWSANTTHITVNWVNSITGSFTWRGYAYT